MNRNSEIILSKLNSAGSGAYLVGECVRDSLMGHTCSDAEIAASCTPMQTAELFREHKLLLGDAVHGTVTLIFGGELFRITTMHMEDKSDERHPDSVVYVDDILLDLSRRDFTMNAVALDLHGNYIDPFSGREDIKNRIIRAVGDPYIRFEENPLLILRAVRSASQTGFTIEEKTRSAVFDMKEKLALVSCDLIREELDRLLCGDNVCETLLSYREIIAEIIPELRACFDFQQHSKYHRYDVYSHIARAVSNADSENILLRRALLFHDIGKPLMFKMDENGEGHFKGHAPLGAEMTERIMRRLRYDERTIKRTCRLIRYHSERLEQRQEELKELLGDDLPMLTELRKADNGAKK